MSTKLEWQEPTADEYAAWFWDFGYGCSRWVDLPEDIKQEHIENWRRALDVPGGVMSLVGLAGYGAKLYTLARAIEFERRAEEAFERAAKACDDLQFGTLRRLIEQRAKEKEAVCDLWSAARVRVDELTAKVLGKEVRNAPVER